MAQRQYTWLRSGLRLTSVGSAALHGRRRRDVPDHERVLAGIDPAACARQRTTIRPSSAAPPPRRCSRSCCVLQRRQLRLRRCCSRSDDRRYFCTGLTYSAAISSSTDAASDPPERQRAAVAARRIITGPIRPASTPGAGSPTPACAPGCGSWCPAGSVACRRSAPLRSPGVGQPAVADRLRHPLPQILDRVRVVDHERHHRPVQRQLLQHVLVGAEPQRSAAAAGTATPGAPSTPTAWAPRSPARPAPRRCRRRHATGSSTSRRRAAAPGRGSQRRLHRPRDPVHHRHRLQRVAARPPSRPDSISADVPSSTALATSDASARVGSGWLIIDSSIWVAVITVGRRRGRRG